MATPGLLYVTMQPKPGLSLDQFHEWYNNEHGPTRLRIPSIFSNGLRYQTDDPEKPRFCALYDVKDMKLLETETQVDVKRYFYDLVFSTQTGPYLPPQTLPESVTNGLLIISEEATIKDTEGAAEEYEKWFASEYASMISKVAGWLRTRLFKNSSIEDSSKTVYFAMHDFTPLNQLDADAGKECFNHQRRTDVFAKCVASSDLRRDTLFYTFGPAPRDLESLSRLPPSAAFTSADGKTITTPGPEPVIQSYINLPDSLEIPYRLEGNAAPQSPIVVFCNSLLTDLHMWDPFVAILKKQRPDLRILRYDTRGRHSIPQPAVAATLEQVTKDMFRVLDAVRIPRAYAIIGVSMGGATTLNAVLREDERAEKFIACDFNVTSSAANTQAWKDRILVAEEDDGQGIKKLATQTVARWFGPTSMENPELVSWMENMVAANNVDGFKHSCTALWDYDLKPKLDMCGVPGLLVVGEADGKGALVKAMQGFAGNLGLEGVKLAIVPGAGHLPMCEQPTAFWDAIKDFL
ncbi:Alpha/Beta hydrolase protein [Stachybotrys elegans]|uniref:Alpha/Beta hydrolase protein n=1 Tax=Stachybotrys elegans TaxID=80388 RepID=A0A8K0WTR5_9HYPO|nr:Alpha/Beta hydrolase protein [Stachybotrys elegans]